MRTHILPLIHRKIVTGDIFDETTVLAVSGMELFGSKIKALFDRAAARDLYDISNMIRFRLFDESESEMLKKCALFYMAVGNDKVPEQIDVSRIDDITVHKIHTDLLLVKRKSEEFNLLKTREQVKFYLKDLMQLTDREK